MDEVQLHDAFAAATPGDVGLEPHAVHVWAVPLSGDSDRCTALLSADEIAKGERFRFVDHRRRFLIGRAAVRTILAGYLGADPAALEFDVGARGKPRLVRAGAPEFNLSHSAQLALVAVGGAPLGVDVEKVRHLERLCDIAQRQFSTAEYAALEALPERERLPAFYRCWTRKEAYVKALGLGLSALDVFDVALGERAALLALRDGQQVAEWSLGDVSPGPDYTAAVAVKDPHASVRQFRFGDL
jgi:4'-phosphopantetheinyl transferase